MPWRSITLPLAQISSFDEIVLQPIGEHRLAARAQLDLAARPRRPSRRAFDVVGAQEDRAAVGRKRRTRCGGGRSRRRLRRRWSAARPAADAAVAGSARAAGFSSGRRHGGRHRPRPQRRRRYCHERERDGQGDAGENACARAEGSVPDDDAKMRHSSVLSRPYARLRRAHQSSDGRLATRRRLRRGTPMSATGEARGSRARLTMPVRRREYARCPRRSPRPRSQLGRSGARHATRSRSRRRRPMRAFAAISASRPTRRGAGSATLIAMDAPPPMEDCRPFVHVARLLARGGRARAAGARGGPRARLPAAHRSRRPHLPRGARCRVGAGALLGRDRRADPLAARDARRRAAAATTRRCCARARAVSRLVRARHLGRELTAGAARRRSRRRSDGSSTTISRSRACSCIATTIRAT